MKQRGSRSSTPYLHTVASRIALKVNKFSFTPSELRLKTGLAVTLMLSTEDFVHGFSVPDFNTRIDLVPGKTVELTLTPNRAGRFVFLCDNFCGDGPRSNDRDNDCD